MKNFVRRYVGYHKACSLVVFNTLIVFAFINIALFAAFRLKDGHRLLGRPMSSDHVINLFGMPALRGVYPGYRDDEIRLLISETWDRQLKYDPFTQYKDGTYSGKWVNVHRAGFRFSKKNGPWPPSSQHLNIFLFGGSTTFGYGVADDQTIASHLQDFLADQAGREVRVYNFGSGCFFSSQERTRFITLLTQGIVPDVAIFIDGLNDFLMKTGTPLFTDTLEKMWDARSHSGFVDGILSQLPIKRLGDSIKARIALKLQRGTASSSDSDDGSKPLAEVLGRYAQNRRVIEAVASAYGTRVAFVWQPLPSYHYHLRNYFFDPEKEWLHAATRRGYTMMSKIVKEKPKEYGHDFLWLADIQEDCSEALYVDSFHYTNDFSKVIADHLGRFLLQRQIITKGGSEVRPAPPNVPGLERRETADSRCSD